MTIWALKVNCSHYFCLWADNFHQLGLCIFFSPKSPLMAATAAGKDKKKKLKCFLFKFVSVLLSASVERVGVSHMWDFYISIDFIRQII